MIREGIQKLASCSNLTCEEAKEIMKEIMSGNATGTQIGSFLTALSMKGETVKEILAFTSVMREFCCNIHPKVSGRLVDTCGTGGDRLKTFNVSTSAAFVVAGTGIAVAKHGNRSVTSRSGSADILEKLGFNLNSDPENVRRTIEEVGIGFMFAPRFHPAIKFASEPRREIGIPTVFNILGPLTNPARAVAQVLGVYSERWLEPLAYTLKELGSQEAMVVHGKDGLDEISILGKTSMAWLKDGEVSLAEITPKQFGFRTAKLEEISGTTPEKSAELTFKILDNILEPQDPKNSIVLMNAAAGAIVGGKADDFDYALELATESLKAGVAYEKLKMMIKSSGGGLSKLEELERNYE